VSTVCKTIRNKYVSTDLINKAIQLLAVKGRYTEFLSFQGPAGDSEVISINDGDENITISIRDAHELDVEIRGEEETVLTFIKELSAEVAVITATELCKCIYPTLDAAETKDKFRELFIQVLNDIFK